MADPKAAKTQPEAPEGGTPRQDAGSERQSRNEALAEAAVRPANGAAVQQAEIGAQLAADGPTRDHSETADALERATGGDKSQS